MFSSKRGGDKKSLAYIKLKIVKCDLVTIYIEILADSNLCKCLKEMKCWESRGTPDFCFSFRKVYNTIKKHLNSPRESKTHNIKIEINYKH